MFLCRVARVISKLTFLLTFKNISELVCSTLLPNYFFLLPQNTEITVLIWLYVSLHGCQSYLEV